MKPTYLIIYNTKEWKLKFIEKRLLTYNLLKNTEEKFTFEHFDVLFKKQKDAMNTKGIRVFGIIIEDGCKITKEEINIFLVPLIHNPFIGGVHVMR